jgi:RNA-directed DNA polymerase
MNNKIVHIEELAEEMNPVIRGWANYFTRFGAREARKALDYVNLTLVRWCKKKYKSLKGSKGKAFRYLARLAKAKPELFYHWKMGIHPTIG